jgi:hypothetical protein
MSWATSKTAIELVLSTLSYFEIPENKTLEDAQKNDHKTYELKWIGTDNAIMHTGGNVSYTNKVRLKVSYINMQKAQRDTNVASFTTLLTALAKATGFNNFAGGWAFEDKDNKNTIGTVEFYFGVDGLC